MLYTLQQPYSEIQTCITIYIKMYKQTSHIKMYKQTSQNGEKSNEERMISEREKLIQKK